MTQRKNGKREETVKVFALNDCDWYAATSLKDAIRGWKQDTGMGDDELDNPHELTEADMLYYKFIDEDKPEEKRTFKDELQRRVVKGEKFPQFFATTEY